MPVVFIIIAAGWSLGQLLQSRPKEVLAGISAFAAVTMILFPKPLMYFVGVLNKENWVPTEVYAKAAEIRDTIGTGELVLTLSPIYVLESGNKIYPQFAAGPFAYRVADFLPEKIREQLNLVGPQSVAQLPEKPDAILIGEEPKFLEDQIAELAGKNWTKKRLNNRLVLIYKDKN